MGYRLDEWEFARRAAAVAFLEGFREGRPMEELRTILPGELEATGQMDAARILRALVQPREQTASGVRTLLAER